MAQIVIPMPLLVPMTLQTLAIALAGVMLGAKKSTIATLLYVLVGATGVPVFAGFTGGIGAVLGPTGGFIMSFPLLALAAGIGTEKNELTKKANNSKTFIHNLHIPLWIGITSGIIINYVFGVIYFSIFTSNDLITSFMACVLFFIPTDILKIVIAGLMGIKMRKIITARNI